MLIVVVLAKPVFKNRDRHQRPIIRDRLLILNGVSRHAGYHDLEVSMSTSIPFETGKSIETEFNVRIYQLLRLRHT
jgi:hypothetical protein